MNGLRIPGRVLAVGALLALCPALAGMPGPAHAAAPPAMALRSSAVLMRASAQARAAVVAAYGRLPLRFEANQGQADRRVRFLAHGAGYTLFLSGAGAALSLSQDRPPDLASAWLARPPAAQDRRAASVETLRLRLAGANPHARIVGLDRLPGISNYFIGNDPRQWRTNVPGYARVAYRDVYPGVDLIYYGRQGSLEYDLVVAPGANPREIRLAIDGASRPRLDRRGNLLLGHGSAEVRQQKPVVYQVVDGKRRAIGGRYVLLGQGDVGFALGAYDTRRPLDIDPRVDVFHLPRWKRP